MTNDPRNWGAPFKWRETSRLPRRSWLHKPHFVRGFVSVTLAQGGVGKSSLLLAEALSICTGRDLLGSNAPAEVAKVWIWNGEDPSDETERRIHAAAIYHRILPAQLESGLVIGSGREFPLNITSKISHQFGIDEEVVQDIIEFIKRNCIDLAIIDPFISSHAASENDNVAINQVMKAWARIANATNCAVALVHHTRKTGASGVTAEDSRGASSFVDAARHARALRQMYEAEALSWGIEADCRTAYVRVDTGKANLGPAGNETFWFKLVNVTLGNDENVQAVAPWEPPPQHAPPSAADFEKVALRIAQGRGMPVGGWRADAQTGAAWVGHAIADALGISLLLESNVQWVKQMLKHWLKLGDLTLVHHAAGPNGKRVPFVEIPLRNETVDPSEFS